MLTLRALRLRRLVSPVALVTCAIFALPMNPVYAQKSKAKASAKKHAFVRVNTVKLRSAPGTSSKSTALLDAGRTARVTKRSGAWTRLRLDSGKEGWVRNDLLALSKAAPKSKHKKNDGKNSASTSRKREVARDEARAERRRDAAREEALAEKRREEDRRVARAEARLSERRRESHSEAHLKALAAKHAHALAVANATHKAKALAHAKAVALAQAKHQKALAAKMQGRTVATTISVAPPPDTLDTQQTDSLKRRLQLARLSAAASAALRTVSAPRSPMPMPVQSSDNSNGNNGNATEGNNSNETNENKPQTNGTDNGNNSGSFFNNTGDGNDRVQVSVAPADSISLANPNPNRPLPRNIQLVRTALTYRGTPYRFGAMGKGAFDCSGFTCYLYSKEGYGMPRTAVEQFAKGIPVPKDKLQVGDLVFFKNTYKRGVSHVGIYIGNGNFVHAASAKRGVRTDNLSKAFYINHWAGARRPVSKTAGKKSS